MAGSTRRRGAFLLSGVRRPGADPTYADGDDASWMAIDWPALTRTIRVGEQTVNVVDTRDDGKPVLLLLHGLSNRWQHWLLTIPALMATHRCIAPDLPGFGESPLPREPVSIRGYAALVDALCQELGVDRVAIVGSSMGGFIGAEIALSFPTRVEKLVLVSAAGLAIEHVPRRLLRMWGRVVSLNAPRLPAFYERLITRPRLRRISLQMGIRYPERLSLPLTWELVQGFGKPGFAAALDALTSYSFRERLGAIAVPTLIVWGENDMLVPVADAARFERLLGGPTARVILPDTGHSPMLERPSRFNAVLAAFLAGDGEPELGATGPAERPADVGRSPDDHVGSRGAAVAPNKNGRRTGTTARGPE